MPQYMGQFNTKLSMIHVFMNGKILFFDWIKEYLKSLPPSPVLTVTLYLVELEHFILFYFIQCIEATRQEHVLIFHYLLRVKTSYKSMMTGQAQKETYIKNIKKKKKEKKVKVVWQLLCYTIHEHFKRKEKKNLPSFLFINLNLYVENVSLAHTFIWLFNCSDSQ